MYQEVCYTNITSDIFKTMKIEPRNKRRKVNLVKLNISIYRDLMNNSQNKPDLSSSTILEFSDLNLGS